jgi:hypothetical protein
MPDRIPLSTHLAMSEFARVWGQPDTLGDLGPAITCLEAETLADMLLAAGASQECLTTLMQAHINSDDAEERELHL